jgi:hypothetical protein
LLDVAKRGVVLTRDTLDGEVSSRDFLAKSVRRHGAIGICERCGCVEAQRCVVADLVALRDGGSPPRV